MSDQIYQARSSDQYRNSTESSSPSEKPATQTRDGETSRSSDSNRRKQSGTTETSTAAKNSSEPQSIKPRQVAAGSDKEKPAVKADVTSDAEVANAEAAVLSTVNKDDEKTTVTSSVEVSLVDEIEGTATVPTSGSDEEVADVTALVIEADATLSGLGNTARLLDTTGAALGSNKGTDTDNISIKNPSQLPGSESLSSAQLASRQAQLASKALANEPSTVMVGKPVIDTSVLVDGEAHTNRLSVNAMTLAQISAVSSGMQGGAHNSEQSANKENAANNALFNQLAADLQTGKKQELLAVAKMEARLAAQKIQQQTNQANFLQARQISLQQVQGAMANTASLVNDSAVNTSQAPDNMFLSLPGGIVTAPLQQRTDAPITQMINAPQNLPILQNNADKVMAGNIRWMLGEGVKNAVVNVTPNGMGPITVTIGMEKDQMNVAIVALQGSTREALDSMLPRLREQLSAQGHEGVKVDISDGRSENTGRGYGQHMSGDENGFHQDADTAGQTEVTENGSTAQEEGAPENSQEVLQVNSGISTRSIYDVYV